VSAAQAALHPTRLPGLEILMDLSTVILSDRSEAQEVESLP
jgi:hypothetical protein